MRVVQVRRSDVAPDHRGEHHFFQVSTLDALIDRRFDGDMTLAELAAHGDHGIGTLNGLDGELVLVDGSFRSRSTVGHRRFRRNVSRRLRWRRFSRRMHPKC
jgi:hypothetical protein